MKPIAKPAPANTTDMPTVLDLFFCFTKDYHSEED